MTPTVGWKILLDEDEWDRDSPGLLPATEPRAEAAPKSRAGWYVAGSILCLTLAVGLLLWHRAQAGLAAAQTSLSRTLVLESQADKIGDELLAKALLDLQTDTDWRKRMLSEMARTESGSGDELELLDFALQGDRAIARVRVTNRETGFTFRESRFYRETADGWLRSQPEPTLWGDPQELESAYFVFHFHQRDGAAVAEAAPVLDAAYVHMYTVLGLPLPAAPITDSKIQVHVATGGGRPASDPSAETGQHIWVNSPQWVRLPDQLSEGDALAEVVSFSLRRRLVRKVLWLHGEQFEPTEEFESGLRLWLAWEETALLDAYAAELVRWLYSNISDSPPCLPFIYPEIGALLNAWEVGPLTLPMIFYCTNESLPPFPASGRPPTTLRHLPLTVARGQMEYSGGVGLSEQLHSSQTGRSIAIATVLQYAAQTYGSTSVSALVQAAREGGNWHTAIPQIFGISAESFEAGWWAWLAEEYGIDTAEFQTISPHLR